MSNKLSKCIHIPLKEKPSEFKIDTDESDITLPAVIVFLGCRGSGKTYFGIMFMRHFEMKKYVNRAFLISPMQHSNDIYSNQKTLKPEHCFTDDKLYQLSLTTHHACGNRGLDEVQSHERVCQI